MADVEPTPARPYGSDLKPEPPVKPIAMGKATRGVELASLTDLDQAQSADWMRQAAEKAVRDRAGVRLRNR